MSNTTTPNPAPPEVTITGFSFDRINKLASFSAMTANGRGNISLSVGTGDVDAKDKDPAKTALKAALQVQFDLVIAALDDLK